ncbi:N-6 DNA methylase [Nonomuraea sp. NPDC050790]|uniref:N-6 DNA methylase n=1 Tax=Nonomuraea sp. NPDC050790 TaxID=3364371 RepID=UPI0037BDC8AD
MDDQVLVTAAEIARLAKVERAAVSNWRRRHPDFPGPVAGTAANPLYALPEVERWLAARGTPASITPADRLWQELRVHYEDVRLVDGLADVASFLSCPDLETVLAGQSDEVLTERIPSVIRQSSPQGTSAFSSGLRPSQVAFWRRTANAASENPTEFFEELHSRYIESTSRSTPATSPELATLISAFGRPGDRVLDPACGTGALLWTLTGKGAAHLAGQEIDPALARIAAFRLQQADIQAGDSLRDDKFPYPYDLVICDPPTGVKEWGHEELGYDPRWEFGLPPRAESELAWVQHCYAHVRPGGNAIVVMPIAAASRRSGRRIRSSLLRCGALRQVIALPPRLASAHALGLHLWVLTRPEAECTPQAVQMIDASGFDREQLRAGLPVDAGVAVPVVELLDDEVDLTPGRYVSRPTHSVADDHAAALKELSPLLQRLPQALPNRYERTELTMSMVPIADLVKTGSILLLLNREAPRSDLRPQPGDIVVPALDPSTAPTVLKEALDHPPPDCHLLRCESAVLDPYFVAGFLRSEANLRQAVTGTGTFRYDVRRAVIPQVPLAEQRRYGAEFRRLAEFADLLRRTTALGEDVVRLAHDGLTGGLFDPALDAMEGDVT